MAIKSLLTSASIDHALISHNCQASKLHRIKKGDSRLKVKKDRTHDHYCIACAKKIIARDRALLDSLEASMP